MKIKEFIKKLKDISKKHGNDAEIVMADNIPVVDPVFMKNCPESDKVIISDQT